LGNSSAVWRIPSLVSGILLIPLTYKLTKHITKDRAVAYLAAFLFTVDCISLTQARIAMLNSMVLMFVVLSLLCFLQWVLEERWSRPKAFVYAGVFLGAALATKLTACFLVIIFGVVIAAHLASSRKDWFPVARDAVLYLGVIPLALFLGVHLFIPFLENSSWSDLGAHILSGYRHLAFTGGHGYGSEWWSWPLMLRPIWYLYEELDGMVRGILCIGNPAVFWCIPLSMGYVLWKFIEERTWTYGLILLGGLSLWLPWALPSRVKFFHFFHLAMPFVCMSIGVLVRQVWSWGRAGKILSIVYLLSVAGLFVYWYPLLTGLPIPEQYYRHHLWFRSWI
jgi:dolichyl-phosphate-mannose--protein O-mannosyl transferase